ncbi:MAG: rhomboid family intramembrane serine protease [Ferruginibacter sp.]|nr:rhomboid family intramembrane serine protease [Cytophagales bacterium]
MQFNLTPVVRNLLILNIAVFFLQNIFPLLENYLGLRYVRAETFAPYQFLTYMFAHGSVGHLFGNMFALFMFGPLLEQSWGPKRFLIFYLLTGVGAGVLYEGIKFYEIHQLQQAFESFVQNPVPERFFSFVSQNPGLYVDAEDRGFSEQFADHATDPTYIRESIVRAGNRFWAFANVPMVGASGAVFGLLMAFGLLFPNTELFLLFIPFPIKAKYFVGLYGVYELYAGIQRAPGDNVAHFAHLGGMLFAFIIIKYWNSQRNNLY